MPKTVHADNRAADAFLTAGLTLKDPASRTGCVGPWCVGFQQKMKNKSTIEVFMGIAFLAIFKSCEVKNTVPEQKVKSITEWKCDPCLWGLNVLKRKSKTQYFDSSGKLTLEVTYLASDMFDVAEHHYDRLNRLSYVKEYRVEGQDTSSVQVYRNFYSDAGKLVRMQRGEDNKPASVRTYAYDTFGRSVREEVTLFKGPDKDIAYFREFQYDSLNRMIRLIQAGDGSTEGSFYQYPGPGLALETRYNQAGQITRLHKRYLNTTGQVEADSSFIFDPPTTLQNDLYAIGKYSYDETNRLVKHHQHYYYLTDCASGRKADWYTKIIEYEYQYYE
jgi:hypothetical protein